MQIEKLKEVTTKLPDWEDNFRLLGIKLINVDDFTELLIRLILNTALILFIVHCIYSKNSKKKEFYFSYIVIGVIVFLLCYLLGSVKLELGFALGLFAIFGIIRYRTDAIPIKEMTYLFIVIGLSVINALSNKKVSYAELILTNIIIVYGLWFLEKRLAIKQEDSIELTYEYIENINFNKQDELLADIKSRTGIEVSRYKINRIDFLRDVAYITLYYKKDNNLKTKKNG